MVRLEAERLIVDEPTRGGDVRTKAEIYALMRELARNGLAIHVISSGLPKILTISDPILVIRASCLAREIGFDDAFEERITALAALEPVKPLASNATQLREVVVAREAHSRPAS